MLLLWYVLLFLTGWVNGQLIGHVVHRTSVMVWLSNMLLPERLMALAFLFFGAAAEVYGLYQLITIIMYSLAGW